MGYIVVSKRANHRSAIIWSESYRDKETKKPKRTQLYLGLYNEDKKELIKGRDIKLTPEILEALKKKEITVSVEPPPPMGPSPMFLNRVTLDELSKEKVITVGHYRILHDIAAESGFLTALKKGFGDKDESLFALMCQRIDEQLCSYLFSDWAENTPFQSVNISKSPSAISNLLATVEEGRLSFCKEWHNQLGSPTEMIKDSTRIVTYADPDKGRSMQEFGWTHHSEPGKRQINLFSLVEKNRGISFYYDAYPGSINDVSTERETTEIKTFLNGKETGVLHISDCGYLSKNNVKRMIDNNIHFIIEGKVDTEFKRIWNELKKDLLSDRHNRFEHNTRFYVARKCKYRIDKKNNIYIEGTMFLSHTERELNFDDLQIKVNRCAEKFHKNNFKNKDSAQKWLDEETYQIGKFLTLKENNTDKKHKFDVDINMDKIIEANEYAGVYLYLSDLEYESLELFKIIHGRDPIEKLWKNIKTDLDLKTLKTKLDSTTQGQIFIAWGAGVLIQLLRERIKKYDLNLTLNELIATWRKIKIGMLRNYTYPKSLTKKSKEIIVGLRMENSFKEFKDELTNLIKTRDGKSTTTSVEPKETDNEKVVESQETTTKKVIKTKAIETNKKRRVRTKKNLEE